MLRKSVYPIECIDNWGKFHETTLSKKEELYSNLNIEDITDVDFMHGKRVLKYFEITKFCEYHNLYLKSDTLRSLMFLNTLEKCLYKFIN